MEDVGNRVLGEFSQRLEQEIAPEGGPAASTADSAAGRLPPADDALDIGAAIAQTAAARPFDAARRSFWALSRY